MWRLVVAGLGAGALLGGFDAVRLAVVAPGGPPELLPTLSFAVGLLVWGALLGAATGAMIYVLARSLGWAADRTASRVGLQPAALRGFFAGALSAPAWTYLVVLGFAGRRARALPHRLLIMAVVSVALAGATSLVAGAISGWWSRLKRDTGANGADGSMAGKVVRAAVLLTATAIVALATDLFVFPHLYPALHLCLRSTGFLTLVAALALIQPSSLKFEYRPAGHERRGWMRTLAITAVLVGLAGLSREVAGLVHRAPGSLRQLVYLYGGISESLLEFARSWSGPGERTTLGLRSSARPDHQFPTPIGEPHHVLPGANILLITVDALRADHLGTYGYGRPTSPALDALAKESVVFERAYATTPHTSYSLTSLLIGKPAFTLANLHELEGHPSLADYARGHGYHTAAFYPPAVFFVEPEQFRSYQTSRFGFEEVEEEAWTEETSATKLSERALEFLRRPRSTRFCLWLHYFAPHEPYLDRSDGGMTAFGPRAVDRYDAEVRWVDREIGRVLDQVRKQYPRTIVVVTADHGEEFGDHGGAYHGTTLFDEQIRVPLIVHAPGHPAARVEVPVSTVDVLPTVLSAVGIPVPAALPGQNLSPFLESSSGSDPPPTVAPVFAENNALKMVIAEGHKLTCDVRRELCVLYDLKHDPEERRDVSEMRPEIRARLDSLLRDWLGGGGARTAGQVVASATDPSSGALRRAALGDRGAVADLLPMLTDSIEHPVEQQRHAARALALLVDPGSGIGAPLRQARHRVADLLTAAWLSVALARLGDPDAVTELPTRLDQIVPLPRDLAVQAAVALAHAGRGDVSTLGGLLAETEDVNVRCALMDGLARTGDDRAGLELMRGYEVIRSRICCANALRRLASPTTLGFILARVADEPYLTVQTELLRAIGEIGDSTSVAVVRRLEQETTEPTVAEVAAAAAKAIADRERAELLRKRAAVKGRRRAARRGGGEGVAGRDAFL